MGDVELNGSPNDDDRKLFVGGLPQDASEQDLKDYFNKFGTVANANVKMDQMTGRSRGFAFVVFSDESTLANILSQDHHIKGKKVAVKKAASKQGKIYVGKFSDPSIQEESIRQVFANYGNVVEIQRPVDRSKNSEPKNFCFVTFEKEETANSLLKKGTVNVEGQEVEIKKVTIKTDGGMGGPMGGRGGMRGGMGGGRGGYGGWGGHGGYDGGFGGGWGGGYEAAGPWPGYGGGWGGGYGGGGWGGDGGYGGGGKMGGGGGAFRGRGRGGRSAPY